MHTFYKEKLHLKYC